MNKIQIGHSGASRTVNTAIIIAGMHRSGTSALARVLSLVGAELPRTLMAPGSDNPKGFWESALIADVNDAVLAELGSSWDDVLAFQLRRRELLNQPSAVRKIRDVISNEFTGDTGSIVVKEPRAALLLDVWMGALSAEGFVPRVVIPVRNPLEIAGSLAVRNGFSLGRSLLLWLAYFLAAERSSRGAKRAFINYTDLLGDWRRALRRLEQDLDVRFGRWSPAVELEVDAFLSHEDRHQIATAEALSMRSDVADLVKRTYQWATNAATAEVEPDCGVLDEVAADFEAMLRIFAPVIAEQRAAHQADAQTIAGLRSRVAEGDLALRDRDARFGVAQEELQLRDDHIGALRADLAAFERKVNALVAQLTTRQAAIDEMRIALEGQTQSLANVNAELGASREKLQEAERRAEAQSEELVRNRRDMQAMRAEAAQADALAKEIARKAELQVAQLLREGEARQDLLQREVIQLREGEVREALLLSEVAQLRESEGCQEALVGALEATVLQQTAHIEALEASVRDATVRADGEAGERRGLKIVEQAQRKFIDESVPLGRRIRRALWKHAPLRPLSYMMEFARIMLKHGPTQAARAVVVSSRLRASGAFDEDYYLKHSWDVRALGQDPVVHYVIAGAAEGRDPSPTFSTQSYRRRYPDLVHGNVNPLFHFVRHGRAEGRIAIAVDHEDVVVRDHTVTSDAAIDPYSLRPEDNVAAEAERGRSFVERFKLQGDRPDWAGAVAALNAASAAPHATPMVSVIVPVYGQLGYTLNCLDALLSHRSKHTFEVVVVDDCSPDQSRDWLARVHGIRMHARTSNGGFIAACNDGATQARGKWLVFLNNDTRVVSGWLDALIDSFATLADAELIGSKLFYPDSSLQEAGGIIWRDGSAWNYGRNDDPNRPEYCYARRVDYVSGASIAVARAVWNEIGGFDTRYTPAYGEDSDLALKVRYGRGKQVWMQPLSRVIHYEGKTSGTDTSQGVKAYQIRNAATLYETWKHSLARHRENAAEPMLEKDRGVTKRALVIDATTPEPDKDAGSLTCFELMRALQGAGYKVSFAAESNLLFIPEVTPRLQRTGIEALYYPYVQNLEQHLEKVGDDYDVVMVFRLQVADKWIESIRRHCSRARVIFHCSDLHFLREERHAELSGDSLTAAAAAKTKQRELAVISSVDAAIVHSIYEQELLATLSPDARVYVFPWILEAAGRSAPFKERRGVAFLGGYRHPPNVDAVLYFAERIWPLIRSHRPDMKFIVAGSECPEQLLALDGRDGIEVVGFVEDLAAFFGGVRLSVAPIRYGAGIKGKVAMSLAHGVPGVLTSCAAEGMGLADGAAVVIRDDEVEFAEAVIALYDDEGRWLRMSDQALSFVDDTYGGGVARRRIAELLALAGATLER